MVFNFLPWLLKGVHRQEYVLKQIENRGASPFADDVDVFVL